MDAKAMNKLNNNIYVSEVKVWRILDKKYITKTNNEYSFYNGYVSFESHIPNNITEDAKIEKLKCHVPLTSEQSFLYHILNDVFKKTKSFNKFMNTDVVVPNKYVVYKD